MSASCESCGAPPETNGCSYCGRGRRVVNENGYYEGMPFDEWWIRAGKLRQESEAARLETAAWKARR